MARSTTARDSLIFFSGNVFNTVLSFVAVLILSRHLGPSGFGVLGVFNSIIVLIIGLTDLGLNTTSIRLVSEYREEDPAKAATTMNVIVRIELLIGALILLIGAVFAPTIAGLLGGSRYLVAVRLGFIAGAFSSAAAFFGPFFVAYRQYVKNALLNLSSFALRTGLVIVLLVGSALSLNRIMAVYTLVPVLFLIAGFFIIPHDFIIKTTRFNRQKAYQDVFHYSKWIFLSLLATGAISRLDILFLARYHGSTSAGYYYAAQQLIAIMPLVIAALNTVLLQRVSRIEKPADYNGLLRQAIAGVVVIALVLLPVLLIAPWAFGIIFGHQYAQAALPFRLLFLAQIVTLLMVPITVWLLRIGQPQKLTIAAGVQFLITLALYSWLIPRYGLWGAGTSVLIGSFCAAVVLIVFALQGAPGDGEKLIGVV